MVRLTKGTDKRCGSWDRVIRIKVTSKGCGSSADGVMGRIIGIQGNCKGCGSSADGVMGRIIGIQGNWWFLGWDNSLWSEG